MSRLAGMYRLSTHVPERIDLIPSSTQSAGATFGPWADHNPRCKCSSCR